MSALMLLLLSIGVLDAKPEPIFANVSIGSAGPYRFLVDTGAETSMIDPDLAFRLGLEPQFQVEIQTEHSSYMAAALKATNLRLGNSSLPPTELVLHHVEDVKWFDPQMKGKLGLNALSHLDFNMFFDSGLLTITGGKPRGETVPFSWTENRITVEVVMGHEKLKLVLDSGSNHVILFRIPAAMKDVPAASATMRTMEGVRSIVPTRWTAEMSLTTGLHFEALAAAVVVNGQRQVDGLLPASVFRTIHVNQTRSELVVQR